MTKSTMKRWKEFKESNKILPAIRHSDSFSGNESLPSLDSASDHEGQDLSYEEVSSDFVLFCSLYGIHQSDLVRLFNEIMDVQDANCMSGTEDGLQCVAYSTPPQEGKTSYLIHYMAWMLIRDPSLKIIYSSYNQERANSVSRQVRNLVEQWTPLMKGSSSVKYWQTTWSGGLLAAGRGSSVTGFSCDLLIIDDPIKNMEEATSNRIRKVVVDYFDSVLLTRMASQSKIVVVCTRWHREDLIAHVVDSLGALYYNVPAESQGEGDLLDRPAGEFLRSVQNRSTGQWKRIKRAVGTYTWQALYQGDPRVEGGSYIDPVKIRVIPDQDIIHQSNKGYLYVDQGIDVIQSWDLAFTGTGDYVAGQVWGYLEGSYILLDKVHERATFTRTVQLVQAMLRKWPQTRKVLVEKAANGAALIDTLRRHAVISPVVPRGTKEARAMAVQPLVDNGYVSMVDSCHDPVFIQELKGFPFESHDDQVDALTQALLNIKHTGIFM